MALVVGISSVLLNAESTAAAVPSGFVDRLVASVDQPTALAFTPDGRILVTTKPGRLLVHEKGTSGTTRALGISGKICSNGERGLLGVAVDPNFAANHYVYLYYTFKKYGVCPQQEPANPNNPVNRVSRFPPRVGGLHEATLHAAHPRVRPRYGVRVHNRRRLRARRRWLARLL